MKVTMALVAFDAGTQIRAAIDAHVVSDYAEAMAAGAQLPPIVLFHDGTQHYLADGFHRFLAAQRNEWREIDAEVKPGTKEDALWFALGANKKNGKRLTSTDLQHAIRVAVQRWPDRSARDIAEQIGCTNVYVSRLRDEVLTSLHLPSDGRVTGKDGKTYPATKEARQDVAKRERVVARLRAGERVHAIAAAEHIGTHGVSKIKREMGIGVDRSPSAREDRLARMREMAAEGHTSIQIAAVLGIGVDGCRVTLRKEAIDVPGDTVTHHSHRHDSNRIVESVVMDAENLTADVNLIDFKSLDRERIGEWADSLIRSKKALESFIKRLVKEQQRGKAA